MSNAVEPATPVLPEAPRVPQSPPETPSLVATIAIVAICLPLPLLMGAGLLSHAVTGASPNGFDIIFFFTYLPLLVIAIGIIEPLVVILNVVYTNRALSGPMAPVRLLVCWTALTMHSLVLLWLMMPRRHS